MYHRRNNRTLKKRIRGIISLTIFITVFLFSCLLIFITIQAFRAQAGVISSYICNTEATNMNSAFFQNQIGIKGLEDFDPTGKNESLWIESLSQSEVLKTEDPAPMDAPADKLKDKQPVTISIKNGAPDINLPFLNHSNIILNTIELNGVVIYKTAKPGDELFKPYLNKTDIKPNQKNPFDQFAVYFSNTSATCDLYDSKGIIIGSVTTTIDSNFLVFISVVLAGAIILAGLFSISIANIFGKLLSISITTPIIKLDEKIAFLAMEDFGNGMDKQIILKKPLREIESLANSTNSIMRKMEQYNHLLEDQKIILEEQNEELEAQNEELTESKKEIEEARTMLVQSENMASIGQLTAAITHEINTPLGAINSNVQLYEMLIALLGDNKMINSDPELLDIVEKMKETNSVNVLACQRVIEIIKSLKTFSKLDQAAFQNVNITDGIKSVLILTSNLWKNKIMIHEDYGDIPPVKCYPGLLNQVFMNIVVNAIQAVEKKGDIFIKTYADEVYINISIKDTGIGIKDEYLSRIFEAGFSTKETGTGAGLGLSICSNIVQKHQGLIDVISSEGNGSEFIIKIPIIV